MPTTKELEIKAKIENFDTVREKVAKLATFSETHEFIDYYFISEKIPETAELRLRTQKNQKSVSLKTLISRNSVQENIEYRFNIDDAEAVVNLLEYLQFKLCAIIRKKSEVYNCEEILIQLVTTEKLGNYIELALHTINDLTGPDREKMKRLASSLGIAHATDSRYYSAIEKDKSNPTD